MNNRTPDLNDTLMFVRVAQAGGFSAAARLMGVPTSTLSVHVARLQQRLSVTLLQRTTRRLHLTEAGQTCLDRPARSKPRAGLKRSCRPRPSSTPANAMPGVCCASRCRLTWATTSCSPFARARWPTRAWWHARTDPIHRVYPGQRFVPPKLRHFIDEAGPALAAMFER